MAIIAVISLYLWSMPVLRNILLRMVMTVSLQENEKQRVIPILHECAIKYRDELSDRNLLIVCSSIKDHQINSYEFTFERHNFAHLTGCCNTKANSANRFFEKCVSHKLNQNDIYLAPNGSSRQKLDVLPKILCNNLSAKTIGFYDGTQPLLQTDVLAGNTIACIGFKYDKDDSGRLHPNTVLQGNISTYVKEKSQVIAVFRKYVSEETYKEVTYKASNYSLWHEIILEEPYKYLLELL